MLLSIVIPARNEEESLQELYRQIVEVATQNDYTLEIIFIDDGSTDRSWEVIERLSAEDSRVRGLRFRRNFGKAAGLSAGFAEAQGDFVITLDADLQDDPHEIPHLLAKLEETSAHDGRKYDVVSGWKKKRNDPRFLKVIPSRIFNGMIGWMTGVHLHDHNCGMKAYRSAVVKEVRMYGEMHRFVPVLAASRGFRVTEIPVQHRARQFGVSKYGFTRFVKGFMDLLTVKFLTTWGGRPQHPLGTLGLLSWAVGLLALLWSIFGPIGRMASCVVAVGCMVVGFQFLLTGLLSELLIFYHDPDQRGYTISERTDRPNKT